MPGYLLDQSATVLCMHGGQAQGTVPNPRVKISGQATMQQPNVRPLRIRALAPKSGGMPLLLQDSQAVCTPNGTGVNVVVTQVRVKAQ